MENNSSLREPLIHGKKKQSEVTDDIIAGVKNKKKFWWVAFSITSFFLLAGGYCVFITWWEGIGAWGEDTSVNWAWDITNFVWWIGIGHAGTFISAILLLFRAKWRNSINRAAEAMTLCAVTCSGFYIIAHLGRPWLAYWVFPIPNDHYGDLWVNFNSALVWDATAVLAYFSVSLIFWYIGLIPDFAEIRNRSKGLKQKIYTICSLNFDNSAWSWRRYESVMLILAGLATALVISVHSIVSMDFANTLLPGWHSTIFPPYFVIGAVLSGFAMVLTLLIPLRKLLGLEAYITKTHIEKINLLIIVTSGLIGVAYMAEIIAAFYHSGVEQYQYYYRMTGDYFVFFYLMLVCNVFLPQLLWVKKLRRHIWFSFILSLVVNFGMWIERFLLIVSSLSRGYLPSSWVVFAPTVYDIGVFIFSIGLFMLLFLLFLRYIPVVNIFEVKSIVKKQYME